MRAFDYIIVGGGSAGCILASRLSENPQHSVLLIEAGASDVGDPKALLMSKLETQDESYDWGYRAQTTPASGNALLYARAKLLGGCANHNDCAFIAPLESDLQRWENLGAKGWGPDGTRAALRRVEQKTFVESAPSGNNLSKAFIEAASNYGLQTLDFRQRLQAGTGWFPLNARGDERQSSSASYLHPVMAHRNNLTVLTKSLASKIQFDGGRAKAVETDTGLFNCNREIILSAGSINTPQLLMLSGIGPAAHLQNHGIVVRQNLPGVGQNLVDHVAANIALRLKGPSPSWKRTPCEATALIQIDPNADSPDVLFHFILRLREKYVGRTQFAGAEHGVKISPNVARPKSRGSVMLSGNSIHQKPQINLNYLSDRDGYDSRILLGGLRFARKIAATPPLAHWLADEIAPGFELNTDDELLAYVRETCETVYHPAGTCRMGAASDQMAIVTPDLKVKGVEGLRVADASVFPDMVTVNINNTVMMVAEKASELILAHNT